MAKNVKPGKLRGNTNPNSLTVDENDHILSIIGGMSYSLRDLAQLVIKSGVTTLREEQLMDGFRLVAEKGIEMALQGNNVNYDYFTLRCGVKGVFNSPNEPFTRPKHQVAAYLSVGPDVRRAMEETLVENMGPARHYAQMDTLLNTKSGEVNKTITSGQVLDIRGVNLAVGGEDATVGLYIEEAGVATPTRLKVSTILTNEPKRLMFMVPEGLTIGKKYSLVHISQTTKSRSGYSLKGVRTEYCPLVLTCTDGTVSGGGDNPDENPDIL